jgi:hypothetical protein
MAALPMAVLVTVSMTTPVAAAISAGGGSLAGTITYTTPLPPIYQGCNQTSWTLESPSGPATVASSAGIFVGDVTTTIAGNSGASCETTQSGGGFATVTMRSGAATDGQLSCDQLTGVYLRHDTIVMTIQLQGQCSIDGQPTWLVVEIAALLVPPTPGADGSVPGVTTSFSSALVEGTWAAAMT